MSFLLIWGTFWGFVSYLIRLIKYPRTRENMHKRMAKFCANFYLWKERLMLTLLERYWIEPVKSIIIQKLYIALLYNIHYNRMHIFIYHTFMKNSLFWLAERHLIKINNTRGLMKPRPNAWWNVATGDIAWRRVIFQNLKIIDCAEFMRVRFTIDSDWRRMSVWIYWVRNINTNIHLTWITWIVLKPDDDKHSV